MASIFFLSTCGFFTICLLIELFVRMDENLLDVKIQFVLNFLLFEMRSSNILYLCSIVLIQDATIGLA